MGSGVLEFWRIMAHPYPIFVSPVTELKIETSVYYGILGVDQQNGIIAQGIAFQ
tara:strand:+ start:787 stop:948 length:162 start_codon:yes stop_codon:yes gene_type:complete